MAELVLGGWLSNTVGQNACGAFRRGGTIPLAIPEVRSKRIVLDTKILCQSNNDQSSEWIKSRGLFTTISFTMTGCDLSGVFLLVSLSNAEFVTGTSMSEAPDERSPNLGLAMVGLQFHSGLVTTPNFFRNPWCLLQREEVMCKRAR